MLIAEQQRMKSLVGEMSGLLVSDLRMCTSSGLSLWTLYSPGCGQPARLALFPPRV